MPHRFVPWRRAVVWNQSRVEDAPNAAPDYESGGQEFESLRARHLVLICEHPVWPFWLARTAFSSKSLRPLMRTWLSSTSMTSMSDRRYAFRKGTDPVLKFSRMVRPKRSINAGSIWV